MHCFSVSAIKFSWGGVSNFHGRALIGLKWGNSSQWRDEDTLLFEPQLSQNLLALLHFVLWWNSLKLKHWAKLFHTTVVTDKHTEFDVSTLRHCDIWEQVKFPEFWSSTLAKEHWESAPPLKDSGTSSLQWRLLAFPASFHVKPVWPHPTQPPIWQMPQMASLEEGRPLYCIGTFQPVCNTKRRK